MILLKQNVQTCSVIWNLKLVLVYIFLSPLIITQVFTAWLCFNSLSVVLSCHSPDRSQGTDEYLMLEY